MPVWWALRQVVSWPFKRLRVGGHARPCRTGKRGRPHATRAGHLRQPPLASTRSTLGADLPGGAITRDHDGRSTRASPCGRRHVKSEAHASLRPRVRGRSRPRSSRCAGRARPSCPPRSGPPANARGSRWPRCAMNRGAFRAHLRREDRSAGRTQGIVVRGLDRPGRAMKVPMCLVSGERLSAPTAVMPRLDDAIALWPVVATGRLRGSSRSSAVAPLLPEVRERIHTAEVERRPDGIPGLGRHERTVTDP